MERLEQLFKKHEMNEIPQNDWLDQLVFQNVGKKAREVDELARKRAAIAKAAKYRVAGLKANSRQNGNADSDDDSNSDAEAEDEEHFTLYVDFPKWDFPVVFEDQEYEPSRMM